jgi:hypothetical protein
MGETRNAYKILVGKPKGKKPFEDVGVNGEITLECKGKCKVVPVLN